MQPMTTPYITLDFRKGRIRIYRSTLKLLDNPDYIRLLVNPEKNIIAVQVSDVNEARGFRAAGIHVDSQKNFDLSSHALAEQLRPCWQWEEGKSYRLSGKVVKGMDIVVFDFNTSVCVSPIENCVVLNHEELGAFHEIPIPTRH